jgi:hypothetical protein
MQFLAQFLTQRIGMVPDVVLNPTITGIRAGRDEVLEEVLRQIPGGRVTVPAMQKMLNHNSSRKSAAGRYRI